MDDRDHVAPPLMEDPTMEENLIFDREPDADVPRALEDGSQDDMIDEEEL